MHVQIQTVPKYIASSLLLLLVINFQYMYVCDVVSIGAEIEGHLLGSLFSPTIYLRQNSSHGFCP